MTSRAAVRAEAERLRGLFEARGAEVFETPVLQEAGALLDLYGEDIRARAFTVTDPLRGEMMLRPDFTLPVVRAHLAGGRARARYAYAGEVFRRQENDPDLPAEYLQTGFEMLGDPDRPAADAEVYAALAEIVAPLGLRAAIGDIGLLAAAVDGLDANDRRKAALRHHLWRPRRFRRLLERFAGRGTPAGEAALHDAASAATGAAIEIGNRTRAEIAARAEALRADAEAPPIPDAQVDAVEALLGIAAPATEAARDLRRLARDLPAIASAVDVFEARLDALALAGVDVAALAFEARYGRTTLEYYDGFVFGFYAEGRGGPPVVSGGRYDALTRAVGRETPAVGGVLRPGLMLALGAGR